MAENEYQGQALEGKEKVFEIIVNTRSRSWTEAEINFRQVVALAYPDPDFEKFEYTVTYSKGDEKKQNGTLVDGGKSVHVKNGMIFDVEHANKS